MKLEVGESLSLSWLRHVRHCQIVQLNWKVSPSALRAFQAIRDRYEALETLLNAGESALNSHAALGMSGRRVVKVDFGQLIRQGEIDALGVRLDHPGGAHTAVHAIAMDVAFHESGLNYRGKFESAARVAKKMLRSALLLAGPLGVDEGEIVFATPKVGEPSRQAIEPLVDEVRRFWKDHATLYRLPDFAFHFLAGADFDRVVLQPLLAISREVADTSELFLRSYQLLRLFQPK